MYLGQFFAQQNLKGGYHLNANSNDFSGNGYNGTDANISYSINGIIGGMGASFNGSTSKISLSSSLDTPLKTGSFTQIFTMLIPSSWTNKAFGICRGFVTYTVNYGIGVFITNTGITLNRWEGTSTNYNVSLSTTMSSGKKYIVCITYDKTSGTSIIYLFNLNDKTLLKTLNTLGTGNVAFHASYDQGYNIGANLRNISNEYGHQIINEYIIFDEVKSETWLRRYIDILKGCLV